MSKLKVVTNGKPRHVFYLGEATPRQARQIKRNYGGLVDVEECAYLEYRGYVYLFNEFTTVDKDSPLRDWDGVHAESYFSGVLVKLVSDDIDDGVIVGYYYS